MERQAEVLIRSIKSNGCCPDSFFTIITHQPDEIQSAFLKSHQIVGYKQNPKLKFPWSACARWNITPEEDLVIGLDSDVVALRDLNPLLNQMQSKKGITGTIVCHDNFKIKDWKRLFDLASLDYPENLYQTTRGQRCPYYVNNGVLALSSEYLDDLRQATKTMIDLVSANYYHDFFITQRATTLAAYAIKIPMNTMPHEFNHLERCHGQPTKDTYFYHYNVSRDKFFFDPSNFLFKMI